MVTFRKIELENGMTALLHQDGSTPLAAVNLLFRAGSKYDPLAKSGLAHLFEHLMFSGTPLVPEFDTPIQEAGGENNAYTNSDYANYYSYGPAQNLETLLWLEADRMHNLNVTQSALEVQQQVVIEELHETCLNVPYGDIWHHVLPLIYRDHPYQWPVIGRDEKEIGDISLDDIIRFHKHYYTAGNAILSVAGNIDLDKTEQLIHQYFGDLPGGKQEVETYLFDLNGYQPTRLQLKSTVPVEAFYMIFPMPERNSTAFYALDLFSDLLVDGRSSILYQSMIKETQLLSTVDAYITGTLDSGLFVIEGRLSDGADIKQVELQIGQILEQQITAQITASTMEKLKNNVEAAIVFAEAGTLNKAMNLSFFELIGDAALINDEAKLYQQITEEEMRAVARGFLSPELMSIFHYVPDA